MLHGVVMAWLMNHDWEQYKKNLETERAAWEEYANIKNNLKIEIADKIERLRILKETEIKRLEEEFKREKERLEEETKKEIKKAHDKYMKKVERKFKPSIKL